MQYFGVKKCKSFGVKRICGKKHLWRKKTVEKFKIFGVKRIGVKIVKFLRKKLV